MSLQQTTILYRPQHSVEHYYLCNYRPLHTGGDRLSTSLLRFKQALSHDLQAWIDCAVSELSHLHIPNDVMMMRALSSDEVVAASGSGTALNTLGKHLADSLGVCWMPELIRKYKKTQPLKFLTAIERRNELRHTYQLATDVDLNDKRVLLIDDIVTTGTTMVSIINLIKQYFPYSRLKVFTLAKSTYDPLLNNSIQLAGDDYSWEGQSWMVAEEEAPYYGYDQLKEWIMKDDFRNY